MANHTASISRLVFGNLVRLGSKQLLENPFFPAPVRGIFTRLSYQYWKTSFPEQQCSNYGWKLGFSGLAPSLQYSSSTLGYMGRPKQTQINGLPAHHVLGRRHYVNNVDRYNNVDVVKTKRRSYRCLVSALAAASCVGGVACLISDLDTIPYSKRTRLTVLRRQVVEMAKLRERWEALKEKNKGNILASYHPHSIRVRSITAKLITALERGLSDDKVWATPQGGWDWKATLSKALVRESCRSIRECIVDWEVIVIEDPRINAWASRDGKIVVYTGLLEHFQSDAEIASVIAHEVGHVVARHFDEPAAMAVLLFLLEIPRLLVHTHEESTSWKHPLVLSLSRRNELEADYIGLLLMASAGYHPRIGLQVRMEFARLGGDMPKESESKSTHPSGKRRVQLVAQAQEEAMAFYNETLQSKTPGQL